MLVFYIFYFAKIFFDKHSYSLYIFFLFSTSFLLLIFFVFYLKDLNLKDKGEIIFKNQGFRVIAELCLHGVFAKEGIQLLGSMISYLTVTDKADHNNVAILLPLCKSLGVDLLGLHSLSIQKVISFFITVFKNMVHSDKSFVVSIFQSMMCLFNCIKRR